MLKLIHGDTKSFYKTLYLIEMHCHKPQTHNLSHLALLEWEGITSSSLKYLLVLLIKTILSRSSSLEKGLFQILNFQIELCVHKLYRYVHYVLPFVQIVVINFCLIFENIFLYTSEPNLTTSIFFYKNEEIDKPHFKL